MYAKVSGYLRDQVVDIGDEVKKDQLLARVVAPELEANVQKARADLSRAKSEVDVMQARQEEAAADLREARAKVEQSQADLESAAALRKLRLQQYQRFLALAKTNSIEQELVDEKLEARRAAEAAERASVKAVATAEAGVAAAEARQKRAAADLTTARAQVQVAEAELEHAKTFEQYTYLRSPYNGVITKRSFHEGDFIRDAASGSAHIPILSVARTDVMRVIVHVPDPDVPFTRRGETATIEIDALPGQKFTGVVARTAISEEYQSRTMRTEVDLPNPSGLIRDGMYGSATIDLGKTQNAFTIPTACFVGEERHGERAVYVVRDGKAHQVTVRVGLDDGIRAEALSGLQAEDQLISEHGPGLAEGVPVEIVTDAPPAK
jgi:RND family efflux transporter MFP subunit